MTSNKTLLQDNKIPVQFPPDVDQDIKPMSAQRKHKGLTGHFITLGFTNRLAIYILFFLAIGMGGGFYLATQSIKHGFTGALACWTVVFTPIGTACSLVLSKIVHKSEAENTGGDGEGIKYAIAMSELEQEIGEASWESPEI